MTGVVVLGWSATTQAQSTAALNYPSGPIKIVNPYPPGGGTDILSRAIGQKLSEAFKQPVYVDNKSGANGTIGTALVAKAAPDGLTLLVVPAGFAANPWLYQNLRYDQARDLSAVTLLASGPLVLVTHPDLNVKSVKELIELARARPGALSVGSAGNGSLPHLSAELFNLMAGTKMLHVAYKGAGPAVNDLLAGVVQVYFMNVLQALPLIKAGKLKALGVTSMERTSIAPDLPTVSEVLPGFDMNNWYGMLAPSGTPKEVIQKIRQEIALILKQPALKEKLDNEGMTVVGNTPDQFDEILKRESDKYSKIITSAGIKNSM
jgi:tripartite-type tricarboxylate transporter receptor subunit TctC